jgi:hypothetical protein
MGHVGFLGVVVELGYDPPLLLGGSARIPFMNRTMPASLALLCFRNSSGAGRNPLTFNRHSFELPSAASPPRSQNTGLETAFRLAVRLN